MKRYLGLEELFIASRIPNREDLIGCWKVVMVDSWWKLPMHRKKIYHGIGYSYANAGGRYAMIPNNVGHNESVVKWGRFYVQYPFIMYRCELIYYKGGIVDEIVKVRDGVLLGKYFKNGKFLHWFWLIKKYER